MYGKKSKKKQQGPDITEDIDQETTHVTEGKQQMKTDTSMAPTGEKIATDRQISKDSVSTVSTEATSRQTSVTDRQVSRESATSLSAATDTNKTSLDQSVTERRTMRRQQSQDQASISSRESTASLQRHRDQQNYSQSTKHIQRAKTKSRACVLS